MAENRKFISIVSSTLGTQPAVCPRPARVSAARPTAYQNANSVFPFEKEAGVAWYFLAFFKNITKSNLKFK